MKRGTLKKKSYEEVLESKRRATIAQVEKKTQKRVQSTPPSKLSTYPHRRKKLPTLKKLRDSADALLTPICKKQSPKCESCGKNTEVGHHWIEKSRSNYLRYDMRNLIPLCHSCHAKIHNRFGNSVVGGLDVAQRIISNRGREWKEQLDIDQPKYVKVDRFFYAEHTERLTKLLDSA